MIDAFSSMRNRLELRDFWLGVLLFGAMPFLSFHAFVFALFYYLPSAPEVPLLLYLPFCWLCSLRAMAYVVPTGMKLMRSPFGKKNPRSVFAVCEAIFWYFVLASVYWHFHSSFGFPKTGNELRVLGLLGSYAVFFVASLVGVVILSTITFGLQEMFAELRKVAPITKRLLSSIIAYLIAVVVFAGIHRAVSFHDFNAYQKPISSTVDALYFSTVIMTTLGFGDITPQTSFAKIITLLQALFGLFMFAVLIGLATSLPTSRTKDEA